MPGASGWMRVWPMLGSTEGECRCTGLLPAVPEHWAIHMFMSVSYLLMLPHLRARVRVCSVCVTCASTCQSIVIHASVHLGAVSSMFLPLALTLIDLQIATHFSVFILQELSEVFPQLTAPSFIPYATRTLCLL